MIPRVATIPMCGGCRAERAAAHAGLVTDGLVVHDERCACYVIVPHRPRAGTMHVHSMDEPRPWVTGARGGRYDVKPPAKTQLRRVK